MFLFKGFHVFTSDFTPSDLQFHRTLREKESSAIQGAATVL